jgi:hypothetical protein
MVTTAMSAAPPARLNNRAAIAHAVRLGRDPATLRRTLLAHRPVPDPLTSVGAFEYVGTYREKGVEEVIFYLPPLRNVVEGHPTSVEQQAAFERIAAQRVTRIA